MLENFNGFCSKADVVKWALLASAKVNDGMTEIDFVKSQEIIDFVLKNVQLPDVSNDYLTTLSKAFIDKKS